MKRPARSIKTKKISIGKAKIGDAVVLIWVDITSHDGWHDIQNPNHFPLVEMKSMGYVVDKTKELLTISHTHDNLGQCDTPFSLPAGCIRAIYLMEGLGFEWGKTNNMNRPNCVPKSSL